MTIAGARDGGSGRRRTTDHVRDKQFIRGAVDRIWEEDAVPVLADYVRIEALSPDFDSAWTANGELERAAALLGQWSACRPLTNIEVQIVRLPGRTPTLVVEVPGTDPFRRDEVTLLYGHLDKQPPLEPWADGLSAFVPVRRGDRLFGRGTADDGYALFAALIALEAISLAGGTHGRCVILIESSEESGSPDLGAYLDELAGFIGIPQLAICLDSWCLSSDRLWVTTSMRGNIIATLRVDVLQEGVHSGEAGGIIPSPFRILRQLLERVEEAKSGIILVPELWRDPPPDRQDDLFRLARLLDSREGEEGGIASSFRIAPGIRPSAMSNREKVERRAWQPALTLTGIDGIPTVQNGANVLQPYIAAKLSFRLSPGADTNRAIEALSALLTSDPPEGARTSVEWNAPAAGWSAPPISPRLVTAIQEASQCFFGASPEMIGVGGTIPFLAMLSHRFPEMEFLVTGVLGPESNAHGPNEFLDIEIAKALTAALAYVIANGT